MTKSKTQKSDFIKDTGQLTQRLTKLGYDPVMIGGMALVILGSRRVTQDFDFVIRKPEDSADEIINVFYDAGFELASKIDEQGQILATLSSRQVAKIRLKIDAPLSATFFNAKTGLQIDLLFDFPISAEVLLAEATVLKIQSFTFRIASEAHLLQLKNTALTARTKAGDAEDIAFLLARQK